MRPFAFSALLVKVIVIVQNTTQRLASWGGYLYIAAWYAVSVQFPNVKRPIPNSQMSPNSLQTVTPLTLKGESIFSRVAVHIQEVSVFNWFATTTDRPRGQNLLDGQKLTPSSSSRPALISKKRVMEWSFNMSPDSLSVSSAKLPLSLLYCVDEI